ncbi:MAG: ferredoxin-thioredoxin reductase catalytic domain-containing protein [Promethearchaeota archaeon]
MDLETKLGMKEYCNQVSEKNNWVLNRDDQTFNDLIEGLVENKKRFGYQSCPCRLACGNREFDRDLICPCDYASRDINEYGACFCNLYLRQDFYSRGIYYIAVPERRPLEKEEAALSCKPL